MPVPSVVTMTSPWWPLAAPNCELGRPRGVRVVDDDDVVLETVLEELLDLGADPGLVDVGRGLDHAVLDDPGDRHADR